jgi:hypothetical protein
MAPMGGGFRGVPSQLRRSLDEHEAIPAVIIDGDFAHAAALAKSAAPIARSSIWNTQRGLARSRCASLR